MAHAYLVVGPESSGTRLMTRIIMACGVKGDDGHRQRWDDLNFPPARQDIVFRRSIPHGGIIPDIPTIVNKMEGRGYTVMMVVMVRDPYVMAKSQIRNRHVNDLVEAYANIANAYRLIANYVGTGRVPSFFVPLEALVLHHQAARYITSLLGLHLRERVDIYDPNAPYYEGDI